MSERFKPAEGLFEDRCVSTGRPCHSDDLVVDTETRLLHYKESPFVVANSAPVKEKAKTTKKKTLKNKTGGKRNA